ncbi:peptidoglycan-binding protein, partial [Vulcaniibacterium gelatinicum]|uniref:peptidoglycan-binding protein n=1 Tax=Vulcaniibacterium gelatinicum TaxID=2598725 RepID=UPI001FEB3D7E
MSNGYGRSRGGFGIDRTESIHLIVRTALQNGVTDQAQIAYLLATAQHETRNFDAPDEDFGRSQARKLGYRGGEEYFGRGYVHLTHIDNYTKFDALLGLDGELVRRPELAKEPEIAARILVLGMRDGLFTGKRLDRYVNEASQDFYNARRVVNGVMPSRPWSIRAAEDCERYAREWQRRLPDLVRTVEAGLAVADRANKIKTGSGPRHIAVESGDGFLDRGDRGAAVLTLQQRLNRLDIRDTAGNPLREDGHFGPRTREAVEAFQRAQGVRVDGVVGRETLAALRAAESRLAQAAPPAAQTPGAADFRDPAHPAHAAFRQTL